jgi:hypothetical protein
MTFLLYQRLPDYQFDVPSPGLSLFAGDMLYLHAPLGQSHLRAQLIMLSIQPANASRCESSCLASQAELGHDFFQRYSHIITRSLCMFEVGREFLTNCFPEPTMSARDVPQIPRRLRKPFLRTSAMLSSMPLVELLSLGSTMSLSMSLPR